MTSRKVVEDLVEAELHCFIDAELRNLAQQSLQPIKSIWREWDYSAKEQWMQVWMCFSVATIQIVYSPTGFGPELPWGVLEPGSTGLGPDSLWRVRLEDAVRLARSFQP